MKPRWHITREQIEELLETHGIEVRMWEVDHNVFKGATVDGYKPEQFAQQCDHEWEHRPLKPGGFEICAKCGLRR